MKSKNTQTRQFLFKWSKLKKKKKALKDFSLVFNQNLHKQKIGVQIHLIHAIIKVGLRGKLIAIPPVCLSVTTQQLI